MRRGPGKWQRRALAFSVLLCALTTLLALLSVKRVERGASDKQATQLKEDIIRAAVTCYSVEGRYPPSLNYIYSYYGVSADEKYYFVTYDIVGDNIMPTVAVLRRGTWK